MQENTNVFYSTKMRILHTLTLREIYVAWLQQQSRDTDFGYVSPDFRAALLWERSIKSNLSTSSLGRRPEKGTKPRHALVASRVTRVSNEPRVLALNGVPQLPRGESPGAKSMAPTTVLEGLRRGKCRSTELARMLQHSIRTWTHCDRNSKIVEGTSRKEARRQIRHRESTESAADCRVTHDSRHVNANRSPRVIWKTSQSTARISWRDLRVP